MVSLLRTPPPSDAISDQDLFRQRAFGLEERQAACFVGKYLSNSLAICKLFGAGAT
jgi:hypothetical protein